MRNSKELFNSINHVYSKPMANIIYGKKVKCLLFLIRNKAGVSVLTLLFNVRQQSDKEQRNSYRPGKKESL